MNRLRYYLATAWQDTLGAWGTLASNALIVSGICLSILMLVGLKRGLVDQLRDDILRSPTAREVRLFATSADLAIDGQREASLERTLPGVPLVIPVITKVATLIAPSGERAENVTLQCTKAGDPFLGFYGLDLPDDDGPAIVLGQGVAKTLGMELPRAVLRLEVSRLDNAGVVKHHVEVTVKGVLETGSENASIAFLNRQLLDWMEDYSQGRSVPQISWPGRREPPKAQHDGYLAFCKKPYDEQDFERLHLRGLRAVPLDKVSLPDAHHWQRLYGLLRPNRLSVYWVTADRTTDTAILGLDFSPTELEPITNADDIFYPWSRPRRVLLGGQPYDLIGVSGPLRWLRAYFVDPSVRMPASEGAMRVMLLGAPAPPAAARDASPMATAVTWDLPGNGPGDSQASLTVVPRPAGFVLGDSLLSGWADARVESWSAAGGEALGSLQQDPDAGNRWQESVRGAWQASAPRQWLQRWDEQYLSLRRAGVAVAPADLLAYLSQREQGNLALDAQLNQFVPAAAPNRYYEARIYATTLDDVPMLDEALRARGYGTISSKTRVEEMQGYAGTLDLLVWVLQGVVFVFGAFTVFVVFMEVTRRKHGSIGIMRIMGMPPTGVFVFVFVRALIVGIVGWLFGTVVGIGLSHAIPALWKADCRLEVWDVGLVLAGALCCCVAGVVVHAWYAANRLDPVDAILIGKRQ